MRVETRAERAAASHEGGEIAGSFFSLDRAERLGRVQELTDAAMRQVGEIVPVTPVPLVCAAVQTLDADFIPRAVLLERIAEVRESLAHGGRHLVNLGDSAEATLDRGYKLLRLRRVLSRAGEGFLVLPHGRDLISFYANSIAHLLGEFEAAVRARDALPVHAVIDL